MAFHFNNASSDRITITDNDNLSLLVSTGWTHSIWLRSDDRSGTASRRFMAWHAGGSTNNYFLAEVGDTSLATWPDDIRVQVVDDDGTALTVTSTSNPFGSNTSWTHVCIVLSGTTMTVYVNGSFVGYSSNASYDDINRTSSWKFGNNQYDNLVWKGDMAEWGKWNRALTDAEIAALSKGYSPLHFRNLLVGYMPMIRDYTEIISGMSVTNTGTTVVDHPRIIYPAYTLIGKPTAVAQTITLSGLTTASTIGTQSILLNINANGVATTTAIGTAVVANTQIISLSGLASTSVLGSPGIRLNIDLTGFVNSQAFGSPVLILNVNPTSLANTSALGSPSLGLNITATGFGNTQAFGSPTLSYEQVISVLGIPSTSVIGTHIISDTQIIVTTGLDSTTAFGVPVVFTRNFEVVIPTTGDFVRVDV